jgi:hypothetical protein
MAKFLVLWEVDTTRTPEDQKERQAQWKGFQDLVKKFLKDGVIKEWGQCAGEASGYCIVEGTEVDVTKLTNLYTPFVIFNTSPLLSIDQAMEANESLPG